MLDKATWMFREGGAYFNAQYSSGFASDIFPTAELGGV